MKFPFLVQRGGLWSRRGASMFHVEHSWIAVLPDGHSRAKVGVASRMFHVEHPEFSTGFPFWNRFP